MAKRLTSRRIAIQFESDEVPELARILPKTAHLTELTPAQQKILAVKSFDQVLDWPQWKKAEYAQVDPKTWYYAEHSPKFLKIADEFARKQIESKEVDLLAKYISLGLNGDRQVLERLLQQLGVLEKPEKNDTNVTVSVSVEERETLEQGRVSNQSRALESLGYTLHTDN